MELRLKKTRKIYGAREEKLRNSVAGRKLSGEMSGL